MSDSRSLSRREKLQQLRQRYAQIKSALLGFCYGTDGAGNPIASGDIFNLLDFRRLDLGRRLRDIARLGVDPFYYALSAEAAQRMRESLIDDAYDIYCSQAPASAGVQMFGVSCGGKCSGGDSGCEDSCEGGCGSSSSGSGCDKESCSCGEPRNNDGRDSCYWCGGSLKNIGIGAAEMLVCTVCGK